MSTNLRERIQQHVRVLNETSTQGPAVDEEGKTEQPQRPKQKETAATRNRKEKIPHKTVEFDAGVSSVVLCCLLCVTR